MSTTRHRIILVDDNMSSLEQGKIMLKTFYEVFPAISAAKLFELLVNITPDLILLDIDMPEMNGYEAIAKLKADLPSRSWERLPMRFSAYLAKRLRKARDGEIPARR